MEKKDIFNLNTAFSRVLNEDVAGLGPNAETNQQLSPVQQTIISKKHEEECECSDCLSGEKGNDNVEMAKNELYNTVHHAIEIYNLLKSSNNVEAWVSSKITKAADYLNSIKHYLDYEDSPMPTEENEEENLLTSLNLGSNDILNKIKTILKRESRENLEKLLYEVVKVIESKN